ncbi:MAG: sugar phosphate nucleotidyltransferase [Thermoplasmata archaeon]
MRAVVTLAGDGSRMLPWTRGLRKEFLPLFGDGPSGGPTLKPVAHLVVEALAQSGVRTIGLVIRPRDRGFVRQYFTVDPALVERHLHQPERIAETRRFHATLRRLRFRLVVQPQPRGFGEAVLRARRTVGPTPFFLHAGDGVILGGRAGEILSRMGRLRARERLDAVLLVRRVADPRRYGVIEGVGRPTFEGMRRLEVRSMVEKPERPPSHWAATAVYAFAPSLCGALAAVRRRPRPAELEVTDGIRYLLDHGGRIQALVLDRRFGEWRSVGSPDGFLRALALSHRIARANRAPARPP